MSEDTTNSCLIPEIPEDQGDGKWMNQHASHVAQTKEREPDVVFIGDSIFDHFQYRPVWMELYEPLHCLNFGISGDKVQNVLWRIQNGALDSINPKVVVLHVGTNNTKDKTNHIADGIINLIDTIRGINPSCYIVLIELLPRGRYPNRLRERNEEVNELVRARVHNIQQVESVSASKGLVLPDGTLPRHDMPDFLHLSDAGYRKAFEPVYELLLQLLFENEKEKDLTPSE